MHVTHQRKQLLARTNRLIGQLEALKRAIQDAESDEQCLQILGQMASIRGAMNGLVMLYIEEHVRQHVAGGETPDGRLVAAEDLLMALRSYRT